MPNWVTNRVIFEGEGAKDILASHLTKNDEGVEEFDFNTVDRMPEDLQIEKSSRTRDGFKLAITKRCPHTRFYGDASDKMATFQFATWMVKTFGQRVVDGKKDFLFTEEEINSLRNKYNTEKEWNEMAELGEKALANIEKYGVPDWYDWSYDHWGCKWNSCNTFVCDDGVTVYFDTPWGPPCNMMKTLAKMHPEITIKHDYAEEQIAFMCGHDEYKDGAMFEENNYEAYSKEAYEMYFDLWGCEENFKYDPDKGTYVEIDDEAEM